jgi:hypothetical protein
MYTPAGGQRRTLSPFESVLHTSSTPEYTQSSHGSPSDVPHIERPGSTASQSAEHLPPFDPYYRQYQGPGIHTGSHLQNSAQIPCSAQILRYAPYYSTSSDPAYTRQGDGTESGYQLFFLQSHLSWSSGPFINQAIESLHASMAQIMAEVKGGGLC